MFTNIPCQEGDSIFIGEFVKITVTKVEEKRVHITIYAPKGTKLGNSKISKDGEIQTAINDDGIELAITMVTTKKIHLDKTASADVGMEYGALTSKLN